MSARGIRHIVRDGTPAVQVLPIDFAVMATSVAAAIAMAIADQLDVLDDFVRTAANLQHERAEFADEVREGLESL